MDSGFYALAGTIVGVLSTGIISWLNLRAQERRHKREIIIKTAIENWQKSIEVALHVYKNSTKQHYIAPLDLFIIHMAALAGIAFEAKIRPEKLKEELDKVKEICNIVEKYYEAEKEDKTP